MKHWYQKPNQLLSDCLRTVLILEGFEEDDVADLPLVTNGIPLLFCHTEKDSGGTEHTVQLKLCGTPNGIADWQPGNNATIIAYFFKPFVMAPLFNIAAASLKQAEVELLSWNAHLSNAVITQLAYATSTARKVEVLDNVLTQQLKQQQHVCKLIQNATDEIMCNPGTEILSEMLEQSGLNERTFQRLFKKYVGITASQYRRICQFQLSFTQLRSGNFEKLTDVAFDNGFADQSHFIRSFKEFTQITPTDYLKDGLKGKNL